MIQAHPLLVYKFNTNPPPNQLELLHRISQTAKSSHCAKMNRGPQNFLIETKMGPKFEKKRDPKITLMSPNHCSTVLVKACWYCWYFGRKPKILMKSRDLQRIFQGWVTAHMTLKSWQHVWKYFRKILFCCFFLNQCTLEAVIDRFCAYLAVEHIMICMDAHLHTIAEMCLAYGYTHTSYSYRWKWL